MLRTTSLKIGKAIYELISDIAATYPIIADHGATYPFITYRRTSLRSSDSKDILKNYIERATVEFNIAATTYDESLELAQAVKVRLEKKRGDYSGITIDKIEVVDANEGWSSDAYIQTLYVEINITKC